MEANCCTALAACDTGTPCGDLIACVRACSPSDDACASDCQSEHGDAQSKVDALLGCYDARCKGTSDCGAQVCDTGLSVPDATCAACLSTSCCDAWKLCSQDSSCVDCLISPTAACAGNAQYQSAASCQEGSCGSLCAARICDTSLGYPGAPACNHCLGQASAMGGCCEETQACSADQTCLDCLTGQTTTGCSVNAAYSSFNACQAQKCSSACGAGS
ncbi:Hypothetical protein A7982_08303 [Minicystis rosea]|nr:Hypothetical protein A7982_08303 [Minicystis rosea]